MIDDDEMTKFGEKLIKSAEEAIKVASGEIPAARITVNGHTYVPLSEYNRVFEALRGASACIPSEKIRNRIRDEFGFNPPPIV